jgi:hypothetical protein
MEITIAVIGAMGVLGGALFANWDKVFPRIGERAINQYANTHNQTVSTQSTGKQNHRQEASTRRGSALDTFKGQELHIEPSSEAATSGQSRAEWALRNFRPCNAGTWNVIVRSFGADPTPALQDLQSLAQRFPATAFKVVSTIAPDGITNERYAIWVGHGLSKAEAEKLVAKVKQIGIAQDSYPVCQGRTSSCSVPDNWQAVK